MQPADVSGKTAEWLVGDERDSFFQIDPELLSIRFAGGRFSSAKYVQGG